MRSKRPSRCEQQLVLATSWKPSKDNHSAGSRLDRRGRGQESPRNATKVGHGRLAGIPQGKPLLLQLCLRMMTSCPCSLIILNQVQVVSFSEWRKIESMERMKGEALGKPAEKLTDVRRMLDAAC